MKSHSDFPINLNFRVSVAQNDFLEEIASLHDVTPSEFLRALLDAALEPQARTSLGLAEPSDARAVRGVREVVGKKQQEAGRG